MFLSFKKQFHITTKINWLLTDKAPPSFVEWEVLKSYSIHEDTLVAVVMTASLI